MNATRTQQHPEADNHDHDTAVTHVERTISAARAWLFERQKPAGHWCADFAGDTTLEAFLIMLETFLGRRLTEKNLALARVIRADMLPEGGWSQYPGGPADLSVSCLSYLALKLVATPQDAPAAPHMVLARDAILKLGGIHRANTYTKYHFAFFGQYSWSDVPAIPPELMFLPARGPFTIYDMSSWSRTIFLPLSILYAKKPVCEIPAECGARELIIGEPGFASPAGTVLDANAKRWRRLFLTVDTLLKVYERLPGATVPRNIAVERAARWMIQRFEDSDGLSAILPAMANSVMALSCLGYGNEHPMLRQQLSYIHDLLLPDDSVAGGLQMQPCVSPVWDTVLSSHALLESGVAGDAPALARAATWLLSKQTRRNGDWSHRNHAAPGGWYFEYHNEFYPDNDDTCMALMVLARAKAEVPTHVQDAATQRGITWLLGMQNKDGGWAAFDKDNDKHWLSHIPFADFNAMIDPSTADITGRVLECLSHYSGFGPEHPSVRRALAFLARDQKDDGSWYGRWGVNYIYGTWQTLRGLRAIGADMNTPAVHKAAQWLLDHQNSDGGWGETIASYDDVRLKGSGASTPSQTAWALMGLIAAHHVLHPAVQRGVRYLVDTQDNSGAWQEQHWTGTGFPRVYYMNYLYYRQYFPLMALAHYRNELTERAACCALPR